MTALSLFFANSIKNDISDKFIDAIDVILYSHPLSFQDFIEEHSVNLYVKEEVDDYNDYNDYNYQKKSKQLKFKDSYDKCNIDYNIFDIWLFKLSENLRRIYSAQKNNLPTKDLYFQQHNLFLISDRFVEYFQTSEEQKFFPRSLFGKNIYVIPFYHLIYLGGHSLLDKNYIPKVLNIMQHLNKHFDNLEIPEFLEKMSFNNDNQLILKSILTKLNPDSLLSSLKYHSQTNSYAFNLLGLDYILNDKNFDSKLTSFTSIKESLDEILKNFILNNMFFSKHIDYFIKDKNLYFNNISNNLTLEQKIKLEPFMVDKKNFNNYDLVQSHLLNPIRSNPYALLKEINNLSTEELIDTYSCDDNFISLCIQSISYLNSNKKLKLFSQMNDFTSKMYPVIKKQHIAQILSFDSNFIDFCKPLYMNIILSEKLPSNNTPSKKHKI